MTELFTHEPKTLADLESTLAQINAHMWHDDYKVSPEVNRRHVARVFELQARQKEMLALQQEVYGNP